MKLEIERVSYRFREPVQTAFGTLIERSVLLVRAGDGLGEAAPLEPYDGVSLDDARLALEGRTEMVPQAAAALDIAGWDARGRASGEPVAALLGAGPPLDAVAVNATIAPTDRAGASRAAADAVAAGFRCLKLKVGVGDDAGRLAAVRAAVGPDVALRIDANGAWSVDEAIAALRSLEPVGIELCEEPVHGVEALRAVRAAVGVPVAMDETAREPGAIASGAVDAVCLKVSAQGGIRPLLEAARAARAAGSDVYLASTFDGPVGIAAALHAAAALRVTLSCGLATLGLFADLEDPFPPRDGAIAVPREPGLGIPARR
jgi:L-alanine-DL-glutamate epimerase-like enolase superfamily enzyme